jgi:hypothetical protein
MAMLKKKRRGSCLLGEEYKRARTKGGAGGREFLLNNEEVGLKRRGEGGESPPSLEPWPC